MSKEDYFRDAKEMCKFVLDNSLFLIEHIKSIKGNINFDIKPLETLHNVMVVPLRNKINSTTGEKYVAIKVAIKEMGKRTVTFMAIHNGITQMINILNAKMDRQMVEERKISNLAQELLKYLNTENGENIRNQTIKRSEIVNIYQAYIKARKLHEEFETEYDTIIVAANDAMRKMHSVGCAVLPNGVENPLRSICEKPLELIKRRNNANNANYSKPGANKPGNPILGGPLASIKENNENTNRGGSRRRRKRQTKRSKRSKRSKRTCRNRS